MRSVVIAVLALGGLAGWQNTSITSEWTAPPEADQLVNPLRGDPLALADGEEIFEIVCWTCHGYGGRGDGPTRPDLIVPPADFLLPAIRSQSDGAIFWKLSTGRGQMVAFELSLTKNERWGLVNYIRHLQEQAP